MLDIYKKFPVIVGLALNDAMKLITGRGFSVRVAMEGNGNSFGGNFVPMRVNVLIRDGIVVHYSFY